MEKENLVTLSNKAKSVCFASVETPEPKSSVFDHPTFEQSHFISDTPSTALEDKAHLERLKSMSQRGRIELIMGPMFAGKSTELLRRVKRLEISGKKCLSIKYSADDRYSAECISTHDK